MRHSERSHFFVDRLTAFHSVVARCVVMHWTRTGRPGLLIDCSRRWLAFHHALRMARRLQPMLGVAREPDHRLFAPVGHRFAVKVPTKAAVHTAS